VAPFHICAAAFRRRGRPGGMEEKALEEMLPASLPLSEDML